MTASSVSKIYRARQFGPPDRPLSEMCYEHEGKQAAPNYARCNEEAQKWYASVFKLRELQHANAERLAPWFALMPIPVAWLVVYMFVGLTRWLRRGFQPAS